MMMKAKREMVSAWMKFGLVWAATAVLLTAAVGGALAAVKVAPPTTSAPDGEVYAIGDGVSAPMLIYTLDPEFPASAKDTKVGFSAKVVVGMIVDDSGTVQDVHVVHSFNPDFDAKAMEAIQQYRFKPAQREGKPVAVRLNVEVNFKRF